MEINARTWNPETHPFVVSFSRPTGDRLTRHTTTQEAFATEAEAIAAASAPFPAFVSSASVTEHLGIGRGRYVGDRKRNKKFRRHISRRAA